MRQPRVIIWPLISPSSAAPSDRSGKSASSTELSLTSAASIFNRFAKSFRAFSMAPCLSIDIMKTQTTPSDSLFHFEAKTGFTQRRKGETRPLTSPLCGFARDFLPSAKITQDMLQQRRCRDRGSFSAKNAPAKRDDVKIVCPGLLDLFVRPTAFGTDKCSDTPRRSQTAQRTAATFGKHDTQITLRISQH